MNIMSPPAFNPQNKEVLDAILLQVPGVVAGTMFGYPAYYVNKKLFACLYEEGVGIKVPEKVADSLVGKKGIIRFQPKGRKPMKEWIQINHERSEDYRMDEEILMISIEYVSLSSKAGR
jgi:hypothetical protein